MAEHIHTKKIEGPRRILAPRIWPGGDEDNLAGEAPLYYLSWPGWELYLARRLNIDGASINGLGFIPLLLGDPSDAERDFKVIDQLVSQAKELGAGLVPLLEQDMESSSALADSLRDYQGSKPEVPRPHLDDRSLLALWNVAEFKSWEAESLLDSSLASQQAMWGDLKGDLDDTEDEEILALSLPPRAAPDPSRRGTRLAWKCWRRLAAPLLNSDDILIATVSEEAHQENQLTTT